MSDLSIVVFAYNFPHKKSQDILLRLFLEGYQVNDVIAMDPVPLKIPSPAVRTKIRHIGLLHPRVVAARIGARYHVMPHNDGRTVDLLGSIRPDLGIIAGARILKAPVINNFAVGIINFHPGLIPEARGLDAMLWSIHHMVPLGVTAHLIDEHIDSGRVLLRRQISVHEDDTSLDLSERLYETQLEMVGAAISAAVKGQGTPANPNTLYHSKMPAELEKATLQQLPEYVRKFARNE